MQIKMRYREDAELSYSANFEKGLIKHWTSDKKESKIFFILPLKYLTQNHEIIETEIKEPSSAWQEKVIFIYCFLCKKRFRTYFQKIRL